MKERFQNINNVDEVIIDAGLAKGVLLVTEKKFRYERPADRGDAFEKLISKSMRPI